VKAGDRVLVIDATARMLGIPADDEEGVVLGVQPGTVLVEYAGKIGTFLSDGGRKLLGEGVPNRFLLLPEEREAERRRTAALLKMTKGRR
jgi:hypothetical protein